MSLVGEGDGLLRGLEDGRLVMAHVTLLMIDGEIVGDLGERYFEMGWLAGQ